MDEKMNCGGEERPTTREATVIEEIEHLPIDGYLKESILRRLKIEDSRKSEMADELYSCYREIDKLEKAVVFLSKLAGEYKEKHNG